MGSIWKEHKAGLFSWEGSADANFQNSTATQAANEVAVGTTVALIFYPDAAQAMSFTGNAVVTSIENTAALGDIQTVSLSFSGTGSLTTDIIV